MRTMLLIFGALLSTTAAAGCGRKGEADARSEAPNTVRPEPISSDHRPGPGATAAARKLFLDVHEVGPGKVTAKDVAGAHAKDLAMEGEYGVDYKAYWVDEKAGKIYCLAEAPSAEAAKAVHQKAHGLLAKEILPVTADNASWAPTPGAKLYLDVHHLGAGKATAADVAAAHQKDLAAQAEHGVKYLNYWFDAESGTVMCLSEAPNEEAALAVHKEAHGLMPDSIEEVSEGR